MKHEALCLRRWAYMDTSWARMAALAPLVIDCAEAEQDSAAMDILQAGAIELVKSVETAVKSCGLGQKFDMVLAGQSLQ